ncbi:hypothetical protein FQN60_009781 [Etheostoma spectabile]|uniref:Secreted protein n=1 Tax=Etheostoma spectabile TaxID=54343 RepID=A0A5J5DJV7_9PERO|nr:hypothetical protein FQN60_009781 [Etheostoma spectabile]
MQGLATFFFLMYLLISVLYQHEVCHHLQSPLRQCYFSFLLHSVKQSTSTSQSEAVLGRSSHNVDGGDKVRLCSCQWLKEVIGHVDCQWWHPCLRLLTPEAFPTKQVHHAMDLFQLPGFT